MCGTVPWAIWGHFELLLSSLNCWYKWDKRFLFHVKLRQCFLPLLPLPGALFDGSHALVLQPALFYTFPCTVVKICSPCRSFLLWSCEVWASCTGKWSELLPWRDYSHHVKGLHEKLSILNHHFRSSTFSWHYFAILKLYLFGNILSTDTIIDYKVHHSNIDYILDMNIRKFM